MDQIEVKPGVLPDVVVTLLRYLAAAIGGYLTTHGLAVADVNQMVFGVLVAVVVSVWGAYRSFRNKKKLIAGATPGNGVELVLAPPK